MELAEKIADYIVETGLNETTTGNYIFRYKELNRKFGCSLPEDYRLRDRIVSKVYEKYRAAICDLYYSGHPDDGFDFMFFLNYCPNV